MARYSLSISVAAALLAGCGSSQLPGGASVATPQSRAIAARAVRGGSWMLPEAKNKRLIYAYGAYGLEFFTYGQGQLVGAIGGLVLPQGMCTDAKGDVWIVDMGAEKLIEYPHGETKPVASLSDPGQTAAACSVDPTTGNLAVTNIWSASKGGNLAIYVHAKGSPKIYHCANLWRYGYPGYDSKGDLFVDGQNSSNKFGFCALYKGSRSLLDVTLDHSMGSSAGPVRWDGAYVAVGNQGIAAIYRFKLAGNKGKLMGIVHLQGSWVDITDFVFVTFHGVATKVLVNTYQRALGLWNYPAGGYPTRTLDSITGSNFFALSP